MNIFYLDVSPVKSYRLHYKYDKQVNIRFTYTRQLRPDWL